MTADLVSRLLAAIDAVEKRAKLAQDGPWHIGNAVDPTKPCNVHTFPAVRGVADEVPWLDAEHIVLHSPDRVLRLCQSHRDIVAMFPVNAPIMDANDCFHGFQARDCGEHRTVGSRAWCHDCGEWCYPTEPCTRCPGVSDVLRALARGYGIEDGETK